MNKKQCFLIIMLILFLYPSYNCFAKQIFTLKDCIQTSTDEKGEKDHSVSIEAVDYFLDKIAVHAKEWPLKFDSEIQREDTEHELKSVIFALETALENYPNSEEILWRLGFAWSMAYNLDLPNSMEKCDEYFGKLLALDPEHPQGNFYYGAHFAGTAARQKDSIPYLEKAVSKGYDEAIYMLGFVYLYRYDDKKALEYFQKYLAKHPKDEQTKKIIKGIKDGKVKLVTEY